MQGKTTRSLDSHGRVTLMGIYEDAVEEIKEELKKRPHLKKRTVTYREFYKIIRCYFTIILDRVLNGLSYDLYNRMGNIRIVKTKFTRYTPTWFKPKNINDRFDDDYWHFVWWDAPKKWRMHKFKLSEAYTKKMMRKVSTGFEYPDYTQQNRNDYIYKVR